jgi:ribonucleoside-diphosphate reductase beta chain
VTSHSILNPGFELSLRPSRYPQFHKQFRTAYENNNWTIQEISWTTDKSDLREKLSASERHVVSRLVAFFATGDQIVANNAALTLYRHVNSPEARMYYGRQIFEECLHIDFYKTLLEEYVPDPDEQLAMFEAVENIPSIKQKADFCFRWMDQMNDIKRLDTDEQKRIFLMNLITFACAVEGIFFFAAFAYVYYLRDRGLLHGLASGTNWVFRDESAHMRFAFSVIDVIRQETPHLWNGGNRSMEEQVREMLQEAIDCEMQFADDVLTLGVVGLSKVDMLEYLRYVADGHCHRLGMEPMFNARCPFEFMLKQDVQALTSFFERNVAEYTVGIGGKVDLSLSDF